MKTNMLKALTLALGLIVAMPSAGQAEAFSWIMQSLSKAGPISNGNGQKWSFAGNREGWTVLASRYRASAYSSGNNRVRISGFPDNWGADDDYRFKKQGNICNLRSGNGRYKLQWRC